MPPPILADSDDDGEDLILEPDGDQEASPALGNHDVPVPALDGTDEQSTGSTERLHNELRSAKRALFTASPKKMAMGAPVAQSSGSPTTQANKRRRTAALEPEAAASVRARVKRSKTTTYSTKRSSAAANDEGSFARLREDGQASMTSQPDANSSNGLPAGSMKAAFADHEPNVLFRDTGSTAVDNESSQQRMIERALSKGKTLSTSAAKLLSSDEPKSSSFPWSASEQTQSTKKAAPTSDQPASADDPPMQPDNVQSNPETYLQPSGTPANSAKLLQDQQAKANSPANNGEQSWKEILEATRRAQAVKDAETTKLRSSPRVEIAAPPAHAESPASPGLAPAPASVPKSTRGRKRKVQEEATDPLNSDDIAVGLPKERYKPRLSRRRATQIDEEPIDFSVRPEKAAKLKLTKTTAADMYTAENEPDPQHVECGGQTIDAAGSQRADKAEVIPAEASQKTCQRSVDQPYKGYDASGEAEVTNEEIFVKPKSKVKSSSKTKRSHTTIFEDHVDFAGSQRTPSLTQQQATRKMALNDAENETVAQGTQRKRWKIVNDDDGEEDELAVDPPKDHRKHTNDQTGLPEHQEEPPPKKRGRPAKIALNKKAKSAEKVLEDSDAEPEGEASEDEPEEEQPPKKKGRGRPSKAAAAKSSNAKQHPAKMAEVADQLTSQDQTAVGPLNVPETAPASPSPSKPRTPSMQAPTPSPEKLQASKTALTPQQKASPTSHSPLKSSSKVPLRVGLSKRQRIPPLLRMMKPPKR
ncbi:hypothetical protein LTR36_004297 [Oleoguttula mirabilis]|uniref:Uncharacterized protein n=1 Tax=Oleoguttula mirabilis TaxID=1507867 RepID=A0AAV9JGU6_9PEZI|nr:hypothetical protein LTR36_004297 [Oleoguttula mirabilis]